MTQNYIYIHVDERKYQISAISFAFAAL